MDILFRLMRKKEDGSFEVVGYEKYEDGKIYHSRITYDSSGEKDTISQYHDILELKYNSHDEWHTPFYIKHDRKDRLLVVHNAVNYFELDLLKITMPQTFDYVTKEGHLYYDTECGKVMIDFSNDGVSMPFWQPETEEWEIIKLGIQGVTP